MISIVLAAATAATLAPVPVDMSFKPDGRSIVFDAYEGDKRVGRHKIRFDRRGDDLIVSVAAELKGRVFFIPFTYEHRNAEVWRDGALLALNSRTEVNDRVDEVKGRRTGEGFAVQSDFGNGVYDAGIISTSWWNPGWIEDGQILNSQKGIVEDVVIRKKTQLAGGVTQIELGGKIDATLRYTAQGCLDSLDFKRPVDKRTIVYKLVARPNRAQAPDLAAEPQIAKCMVDGPQLAQAQK